MLHLSLWIHTHTTVHWDLIFVPHRGASSQLASQIALAAGAPLTMHILIHPILFDVCTLVPVCSLTLSMLSTCRAARSRTSTHTPERAPRSVDSSRASGLCPSALSSTGPEDSVTNGRAFSSSPAGARLTDGTVARSICLWFDGSKDDSRQRATTFMRRPRGEPASMLSACLPPPLQFSGQ